nr:uncharacterized protein LOC127341727 [Lolium perenne]
MVPPLRAAPRRSTTTGGSALFSSSTSSKESIREAFNLRQFAVSHEPDVAFLLQFRPPSTSSGAGDHTSSSQMSDDGRLPTTSPWRRRPHQVRVDEARRAPQASRPGTPLSAHARPCHVAVTASGTRAASPCQTPSVQAHMVASVAAMSSPGPHQSATPARFCPFLKKPLCFPEVQPAVPLSSQHPWPASQPPWLASSRICFFPDRIAKWCVSYAKSSGCSSTSFNRYEDMFDEDDASKVTLPAWPGQGYGRHWLSSGLLVQFVSCPYSDVFTLLYDLDLCIVYLYLDSLESLL